MIRPDYKSPQQPGLSRFASWDDRLYPFCSVPNDHRRGPLLAYSYRDEARERAALVILASVFLLLSVIGLFLVIITSTYWRLPAMIGLPFAVSAVVILLRRLAVVHSRIDVAGLDRDVVYAAIVKHGQLEREVGLGSRLDVSVLVRPIAVHLGKSAPWRGWSVAMVGGNVEMPIGAVSTQADALLFAQAAGRTLGVGTIKTTDEVVTCRGTRRLGRVAPLMQSHG